MMERIVVYSSVLIALLIPPLYIASFKVVIVSDDVEAKVMSRMGNPYNGARNPSGWGVDYGNEIMIYGDKVNSFECGNDINLGLVFIGVDSLGEYYCLRYEMTFFGYGSIVH